MADYFSKLQRALDPWWRWDALNACIGHGGRKSRRWRKRWMRRTARRRLDGLEPIADGVYDHVTEETPEECAFYYADED